MTAEEIKSFELLTEKLFSKLILQKTNPGKPFALRGDSGGYAVGMSLEQLQDETRLLTPEDVREHRTVQALFMRLELRCYQRNSLPREQQTYAIRCALQKWESWIGRQLVVGLTDHKSMEGWAKEGLDAPSGPAGRRSTWRQILSKSDITVGDVRV